MSSAGGTLLVTGRSGFVGGHVGRVMDCVGLEDGAGLVDLREPERVEAVLADIRPAAVLHLAAQSFVPESFRDPVGTFQVNVIGTLNLLAALEKTGFTGRFLYVSSGEVYGLVPEAELPVGEDAPTRPRNPYAASKVAAEAVCYQWSRTAAFEVAIARPFNHIGPGQDRRFAIADFAAQLAEIARGGAEPVLNVGDVDVTRDFTDVRDVVGAYAALLRAADNGGVYNVCSGQEYQLRSLIEKMADMAGVDVTLRQDAGRFRPSEQRRMRGANDRLRTVTGWQPGIAIERSLEEIISYELEAKKA